MVFHEQKGQGCQCYLTLISQIIYSYGYGERERERLESALTNSCDVEGYCTGCNSSRSGGEKGNIVI